MLAVQLADAKDNEVVVPGVNDRNACLALLMYVCAPWACCVKYGHFKFPGQHDYFSQQSMWLCGLFRRMQDFFTETEVNCLTPQGFGALHFAVSSENVAAIELLASHPFLRVDACGKSGAWTA